MQRTPRRLHYYDVQRHWRKVKPVITSVEATAILGRGGVVPNPCRKYKRFYYLESLDTISIK